MKKIATFILSIFLIGAYSFATAETAAIRVAERDCKNAALDSLLTVLSTTDSNRWKGSATNNSGRENTSSASCTGADIQVWMNELQTSCTIYFDLITLTPIIKGYSEIVHYNSTFSDSIKDGRGAGYGYSYTDRLIMVYRCL